MIGKTNSFTGKISSRDPPTIEKLGPSAAGTVWFYRGKEEWSLYPLEEKKKGRYNLFTRELAMPPLHPHGKPIGTINKIHECIQYTSEVVLFIYLNNRNLDFYFKI